MIGGPMSLNMFLGLVGVSGLGKGAADVVGAESIDFRWNGVQSKPIELPSGSGEGISRSFRQADDPDDDAPDTIIFHAAEVDSLTAIGNRQGSTFEPESRKLYSGEALGFANAQKHTRTRVAAHSYRAGFLVGIQPGRSGALFRGADGGTPQRFIWMPVDDPTAPDDPPDTPEPLKVQVPNTSDGFVSVPEKVRNEILAHRRSMLRGDAVDPLNGHRLLSRLKVATALAVLDGNNREQLDVTEADWELSAHVMATSDRTREMCRRTVEDKARAANRARAHETAEREEVITSRKHARAKQAILRWLEKPRGGDNMARNQLRRKLKADVRDYFDPALAELVDEKAVEEVQLDGGVGYRLGTRVPGVHAPPPAETGVSQRDTCTPGDDRQAALAAAHARLNGAG
jgi:hypothetical protein